jgi:dUTP pyrophosphatase
MEVKIEYLSHFKGEKLQYATPGSSGIDLRAAITEPLWINSLERILIPAGIKLEIPEGYEGQVRSRSGLALKYGIFVLNGPGTIDSDYRGEVKIILANFSHNKFKIEPGMRIAQLVFNKIEKVELEIIEKVSKTHRNTGGFGHTGLK